MALFEPLFQALNDAGVRYVVVGGLAVVLHGHARLTVDVDLVVDLGEDQALKAIETLVRLGLRPRVPVNPRDFADPAARASGFHFGMQVFSMSDPQSDARGRPLRGARSRSKSCGRARLSSGHTCASPRSIDPPEARGGAAAGSADIEQPKRSEGENEE
jgi:hypothetical protein